MELALINAIEYMWSSAKVKIYNLYWKQAMENKRKKYQDILNKSVSNQEIFKCLLMLPLIPADMLKLLFNEIRNNNQNLELDELFE